MPTGSGMLTGPAGESVINSSLVPAEKNHQTEHCQLE
jgi:hypothetical protein